MDYLLYFLVFCMGATFGSFFTLAVYRIPIKQDITHTRSYCPTCGHKLSFLDMIPILSYVCLGGKCRYCKEKIRPRYFIIELISGISFVAIAYLMNLNIESITIIKIIDFAFIVLYLTCVIIMAGIDKEDRSKTKPIIMYGVIISIIYIVYLCIIDITSIYRYGIYLVLYIIVLLLDTVTLKKMAINKYVYSIVLSVITMAIFSGEYATILSVITTLLAIAIYELFIKLKNSGKSKKTEKNVADKISIGFYLAIPNIIYFICILAFYKFLV